MKTSLFGFLLVSSLGLLADNETVVTPVIESVGLFKNGLAVVHVRFPVARPGAYRWDHVPRVVHGSFWVESDGEVVIQSTRRMIEEPVESPEGSLQRDLAGKEVTLQLKSADNSGEPVAIRGKVWDVPVRDAPKSWDTNYRSLDPAAYSPYGSYFRPNPFPGSAPNPPSLTGGFLVLDAPDGGRRYVDLQSIASVSVAGPISAATRQVERPVLRFDVRRVPSKGGEVRISYLTKGLAWMPAYQVDLSDPQKLRLRQSAVVRNEFGELHQTQIELISGFPNVRFGAVDSPLSPGTQLAAFFQQISQSSLPNSGGPLSNAMTQQIVFNGPARAEGLPDLNEGGGGSGDDLYYQKIGRHDLKPGDSLALEIASQSTDYKRIVEWVVPDNRDPNGRYASASGNRPVPDDSPWDAVRFRNPFDFPMTTASALVVENGRFRGQCLSEWVNPGQSTSLRVTKALSVRSQASEVEEEGQREIVWIAGNDYQRTRVKGRLTLHNYRDHEITLSIRCDFSGELLEAEGDPQKTLRTEGVGSVNPRRQLNWTLKLPAASDRSLTYRYQVLVDR